MEYEIGEAMRGPLEPLKDELDLGKKAAHGVVDHMKIMGAAATSWTIPDGDGVWVVKVEYRGKDKE